jgi:hypothetical protein
VRQHGRAAARVAATLACALALPSVAWADAPPPRDPGGDVQGAGAAAGGIAVLARPGAEGAAWGLAQEVYARGQLRPPGLDERRARVLVGGPQGNDASPTVTELADERAGVHGEDGASRALLRAIASLLGVRAIVVVETGASGEPSARVFLVDGGVFDAARYAPDAPAPATPAPASDGGMDASPAAPAPPAARWAGTVASLERAYGAMTSPASPATAGAPEATRAPVLATSPLPPEKPKGTDSHPFYTSPWFWGAVGAAAFGATAVYFATRDNSTGTIHLQLEVPK